jgi:hypothetical protein
MLICPEPTYEGLVRYLAVGQPSVGIFSAEGGAFIGGHGMSNEGKLRTAAGLSSLWDGETIRRVRAGDGAVVLPGKRLTVHLMAQPDVAATLLSDPLLADQGLLSRMLVTAPASTAGTRLWREPRPESDAALKRYGARLLSILEMPLPIASGRPGELVPRVLPLSGKGITVWTQFADHVEGCIAPGRELDPIRGLANKLPEHAARIAAVLAMTGNPQAVAVAHESLEAAIAIVEHYAGEALRMFHAGHVRPELRLAQKLLAWILTSWPEVAISLPDIYQLGPSEIRDKDTAKRTVTVLEEHGWLQRIPGGATVAGNRRREAWAIVKG